MDHHWIADDRKSHMLPNTLRAKLFRVNSMKNKKDTIKKGKLLKFHSHEKALSRSRK